MKVLEDVAGKAYFKSGNFVLFLEDSIDIFVIVKNGKYKFRKIGGLYEPIVFDEGEYHYFVMPEDGGEDLLNAMLYTGRKNPDKQHRGIKVSLL